MEGQQERQVSLGCYFPAPPGASKSELCLCPGGKKKRRLGWGVASLLSQMMGARMGT